MDAVIPHPTEEEALILKTSGDSYFEVFHAKRSNPDLKDFGEDVQKVKRILNGEIILELK